jgi:hypothetical protein
VPWSTTTRGVQRKVCSRFQHVIVLLGKLIYKINFTTCYAPEDGSCRLLRPPQCVSSTGQPKLRRDTSISGHGSMSCRRLPRRLGTAPARTDNDDLFNAQAKCYIQLNFLRLQFILYTCSTCFACSSDPFPSTCSGAWPYQHEGRQT